MGSPQGSGSPSSLALPRPKSPPELYAKRRDLAKLVMLEREIGFLQEELKSIETLQPASFCIKEVADYVVTNPEPLITVCGKTHKTCGFWKWLCGNSCFGMSSNCCCTCCLETPSCCCCCCCSSCSLPKCTCSFKPRCPSSCFCCSNCSDNCCPKCPDCSCRCKCSCCLCWPPKCLYPKFPKCSSCCCCSLNCCYSSRCS